MTMEELWGNDKLVSSRQKNDLEIKKLSLDTEIGQGQGFNEYELVQDEYLKTVGTNKNIEQPYRLDSLGNNDKRQLNQL